MRSVRHWKKHGVALAHSKDKTVKRPTTVKFEPQSSSEVPVLLIEPNALIREGLAKAFELTRFRVVASCSSFGALPLVFASLPELIVVGGSDFTSITDTLKDCAERYPSARRVVLGSFDAYQMMSAINAGAHCCLGRDISVDALLKSLDLALMKGSVICQWSALTANHSMRSDGRDEVGEAPIVRGPNSSLAVHKLSERELAILGCLMHGDANKVIGRKLQLAEATVKAHMKSILRKTQLENRTQAAIWAQTNLAFATEQAPKLVAGGVQPAAA